MSSVYWLARAGVALAGRTPSHVRHALASAATAATYLGWRDKRLATRENMARVLGLPVTDRRVRRTALASWTNYGRTAADLVNLPYLDLDDVEARIQDQTEGMTWLECLRSAMAPGNGLVIATGHFGSWDLAGAVVARHVPLSAIADTFEDPQLNTLLQGHRRDRGVQIIPASGAARRATEQLLAGGALAIVIDRPVSRRRGVGVSFLGHRTYVPIGSAAFAVRTGASIMPGYFWYAPHSQYYLRAFPPVFPRAVGNRSERMREIQRLTQYMFSCQEEVVRQCPAQWFMFRRFWPAVAEEPGPGLAEAA
jgi:phosphatidylinositol dimannoside acyltransferase